MTADPIVKLKLVDKETGEDVTDKYVAGPALGPGEPLPAPRGARLTTMDALGLTPYFERMVAWLNRRMG